MTVETPQDQLLYPYVLVVFPRNEDVSGLLSAVAVTGRVPLICHTFEEAQEVMKYEYIHIIIWEDHLPDTALASILKLAKHRSKPIPVIVASRTGEWEEFLEVLRQGAFEYLVLPPRQEEVKRVLELATVESGKVSQCESESRGPRPFSTGEFVLGVEEARFEGAAQRDARTLEPPAHVWSNDELLR